MNTVSNATPIISLASIGQIDLLPRLFGEICVPRAVYQEIKAKRAAGYDEIDAAYFRVMDIQGALCRLVGA